MFKGTLHRENENGRVWNSENKRWRITKYNTSEGVGWTVENSAVPYHDNPRVFPNGEVIFNKPAGLPTYVREQFLKMVENHVAENPQ